MATDPILSKLLASKDKIAKLPLSQQKSIWTFAFAQSVRPKLEALGTGVEDLGTAKDRFVTSMTGGEQAPSPDVVSEPSTGDKVLATIGAAGAGIAGGLRRILPSAPSNVKTGASGAVTTSTAPSSTFLGNLTPSGAPPVGQQVLEKAESGYDTFKSVAPTAAPIAAAVGHQVPAAALFEAGASLVPELEGADVAKLAKTKLPLAARAANQFLRTTAGTAAMELPQKGTSTQKVATDALTFSALDALLHGAWFGGSAAKDAAQQGYSKLRSAIASTGQPVDRGTITGMGTNIVSKLREMFPEKAAAADANKTPFTQAFTPEEQNKAVDAVITAQRVADATERQNTRTQKQAQAQLQKENAQGQALLDKATAKARSAAVKAQQNADAKALAGRLSDYRKATGIVPAEGSAALESLKKGISAKEVLAGEKSRVIDTVGEVKDRQDGRAIVEAAPEVPSVIKDLDTVATTQEEPGLVDRRKQELRKTIAVGNPQERRIATEILQRTYLGPERRAAQALVTEPVATTPTAVAKPKVVKEPPAWEKFGVTLDTSTWKTPEDVIAGKKAAEAQLTQAATQKANELSQQIKTGVITQSQADVMKTQLGSDFLKAVNAVRKGVKTPGIGRAARDRVRKGIEDVANKGVLKGMQEQAESTGRAVGNAAPSEEDAYTQMDQLLKIGFGSTARKQIADEIMKFADANKLNNVSRLEMLQEAYTQLKREGGK